MIFCSTRIYKKLINNTLSKVRTFTSPEDQNKTNPYGSATLQLILDFDNIPGKDTVCEVSRRFLEPGCKYHCPSHPRKDKRDMSTGCPEINGGSNSSTFLASKA